MTHDNRLGLPDPLDVGPDGIVTLTDTLFVALAAVAGVVVATLAATLVAPVAPGVGLVAVFAGWPVGFVAAVTALRFGRRTVARSGLPASARDAARRVRTTKTAVATDGGHPDEPTCNC